MRVGVLGINHKLAGLELRELLAQACQKHFFSHKTNSCEDSFILLSTCNRTEIYFSSEQLADTHSYLLNILRSDVNEDFDQRLYSYFGRDCLQHLCRVTSGLDSAIIAETEIQGQVKIAYETTKSKQQLPFELHYLFQKSLAIAKKTRSLLPVKPGLPDIEHSIFQWGENYFQDLSKIKILFVGASDINEKILHHLQNKGVESITLCNRSYDKGLLTALKHQIPFTPWEKLGDWTQYDWVIVGTKAPYYLLNDSDVHSTAAKPKLLIDLSVPRNIDPQLARLQGIKLLNIDQINRSLNVRNKTLTRSLKKAERYLISAVDQQVDLYRQKTAQRERFFVPSCA